MSDTCGHDSEGRFAAQDGLDDGQLQAAEGREAKVGAQCRCQRALRERLFRQQRRRGHCARQVRRILQGCLFWHSVSGSCCFPSRSSSRLHNLRRLGHACLAAGAHGMRSALAGAGMERAWCKMQCRDVSRKHWQHFGMHAGCMHARAPGQLLRRRGSRRPSARARRTCSRRCCGWSSPRCSRRPRPPASWACARTGSRVSPVYVSNYHAQPLLWCTQHCPLPCAHRPEQHDDFSIQWAEQWLGPKQY